MYHEKYAEGSLSGALEEVTLTLKLEDGLAVRGQGMAAGHGELLW